MESICNAIRYCIIAVLLYTFPCVIMCMFSILMVYSVLFCILTVPSGCRELDKVIKFVACGDLSGYDSDKTYPLEVIMQYMLLQGFL